MSDYHYGLTIKKYREMRNISQQELAEKWPRSDGGLGVSWQYVQLVEYGKRKITDVYVLRKLCDLLEVPLFEFGLSDYDPFNTSLVPGGGVKLYNETLDLAEALIHQTFAMRRYAPVPEVEKSSEALNSLFHYFKTNTPPTAKLEPRFLQLYAQSQNIRGLVSFENKQYAQALHTFEAMYRTSKEANDPTLTVHALQKMGVELRRAGRNQEAVHALEEARDVSFRTGKHVAAFANAYLAHIYAAVGDGRRFERAIDTAINIAEPLKEAYGDGTDFVHHKFSGILQLKSRGYLRINQPQKTLALHDELQRQIKADSNFWLDHRLHLYCARAHLMLRDVEACIEAAYELFTNVRDWHSPHRTARAFELLEEIEQAGYGQVKSVVDFKDALLRYL
ncbi:hypothetical protein KSC_048000 [Ktedonobacter sp. SOSP1-52]|uniref:helix-turn-helix domain-containing protein n=1 Tax=Ktedonobacter sp. SOSP1-52 TaxID=2778366 RepID=UPI0019152D92|nr:helix-turn-helix transcriptional regulator [Ktedonobacter sp. SOSP1-52]GHO65908.1 hypothetical protein KSC_048000 [Ktedonobacter sp. SOSP1-52]